MPRPIFSTDHKSTARYLDLAANAHGREKGFLMLEALRRTQNAKPHIVEIGPGGGASVEFLSSQIGGYARAEQNVALTLIEAPGVESSSLASAISLFRSVGSCELVHGFAQDIHNLLPCAVDIISTSALFHEVYSYGGGYSGLHAIMRTLPTVLVPGGFFAYRDVYAVDSGTLHRRVTQCYEARSWLQFIRMFLPYYLEHGTHPYHHADDEIVVRQNSRIVDASKLDTSGECAFISAPLGLFREIQRHYITFRDHVWRSGTLGFTPALEGQLSNDWIDLRTGHKRVHYTLCDAEWLTTAQKTMLRAMSEPYDDHHTIDGDIFDNVTDVALTAFLDAANDGDTGCTQVWKDWRAREGHETYAYLTLDELLCAFAENSVQAATEQPAVLMPVQANDVRRIERHYYNRFLSKRLPNPLLDAKQLVLFRNIPLTEVDTLTEALETLQGLCAKESLARVYEAVNRRG
ncbi:hypothetical protein SAMN05421805_103140 [Saccharopolyspora antimicrobica]|uniref:Methyltransferase domain-containing protein n=1 Tax=Saccharopolyspora antimicrobica TaxID=455193 RepID=A0A1I4WXU7_9PSEU|nr:hypothetical protein [Saccharopolyspora antimicrobica]RKT84214.1 hypothetical protein ATL45_2524 [Saccharopolyspora antimicrobica]SFN18658.1 hypothetical protein SAMN05421805_103140 [Saccharopolyspora antimicrobica]